MQYHRGLPSQTVLRYVRGMIHTCGWHGLAGWSCTVLYVSKHIRALGTANHGEGDVSGRRMCQPGVIVGAGCHVLRSVQYNVLELWGQQTLLEYEASSSVTGLTANNAVVAFPAASVDFPQSLHPARYIHKSSTLIATGDHQNPDDSIHHFRLTCSTAAQCWS